jgi:argininosuccinate lyase
VNGSRLLEDRSVVADLLGFGGVIEHTRDAMWQVDGLINILATTTSMLSNQSKLAEDLEIWSSSEFDYVDLDDGFTRSSVLMPQKRNPYSLSIVRGASGILIGRLSGFLAVVKSPSARSDNLIFAYGEVPRALDLASRVTRLMSGVVGTLRVNSHRMADALGGGFTQATDLAEHIVQVCRIDYRTAYVIVGATVRAAAAVGLRGVDITGEMLDNASVELQGRPLGLAGHDLSAVLDPRLIVSTRSARGGAAPEAVMAMVESCRADAAGLHAEADRRRAAFDAAEEALLKLAGEAVGPSGTGPTGNGRAGDGRSGDGGEPS